MATRRPFDLDRILRSWPGRAFLVLLVVTAVSLVQAVPRGEIVDLMGGDVDFLAIFLDRFLIWACWGLLVWPLLAVSGWLLRTSGSWLVLLLVQIPLSGAVAWGFVLLDHHVQLSSMQGPGEMRPGSRSDPRWEQRRDSRPDREEEPVGAESATDAGAESSRQDDGRQPGEARRDDGRRSDDRRNRGRGRRGWRSAPDWSSPFWRLRWMEGVLVYWVILALGGGLHSFIEMRRKERSTADLELRAARLGAQLAEMQVSTLRGQLHPHFLFNALHSVGGLIRAGEEGLALRTLAAIGELLRSTLDHGADEKVRLRDEWRIAERYLEIEGIRLGERLSTSIEAEEGVQSALIPALLLLPLVENAVRHGVAPRPEGGSVRVSARREGTNLVIEVDDDGSGFPASMVGGEVVPPGHGHQGIGLENSRERLRALYGEDQRFELTNGPEGGARVRVVLPYVEEIDGNRSAGA